MSSSNRTTQQAGLRRGQALLVLALVGSMVVVGFQITVRSVAAFSATTTNAGNSFAAGTVALTDDDSASALFSVSGMSPGDSVVDCIVVTYNGTIADPGAVRIYNGGFTDSGDFADYLNVTIEEGTGGAFGSCGAFSSVATIETGGTLTDFATNHTNYATGAGTWDPSSTPVSVTYRITVALDGSTPNAEMGQSVTALAFTWEVQS